MRDVKVLHYQYADWTLMKRKQMWYQCWERLNTPGARPSDLHRRYHHMDAAASLQATDAREMVHGLRARGVPARATVAQPDRQVGPSYPRSVVDPLRRTLPTNRHLVRRLGSAAPRLATRAGRTSGASCLTRADFTIDR